MRDENKTKAQLIRELAELRQQGLNIFIQELRETRKYLEKVFENSPDAAGIVDNNGKFLKSYKMVEELFGYSSVAISEL
ncbi:MAG: PAS domain S-box protein [Deltaproteobacteria bacterium]|nr:PAS domain S-box protein [Deltaproteobacteria bacterium]MBI4796220.1 PAS domain S-box protein [Deltaproteobacteria bacterium]